METAAHLDTVTVVHEPTKTNNCREIPKAGCIEDIGRYTGCGPRHSNINEIVYMHNIYSGITTAQVW